MQSTINENRQEYDNKMKTNASKFDNLTEMIWKIMDRTQI